MKIEPNGAAGTYLREHVRVGDALDVSAPRGSFILQSGERPVVLLSAGIGATPVLAMLHALAATRSTRPVWWLHGARDGQHHPFAAEVRRLMLALPHGRSYVCYSRPGSYDTKTEDFDATGTCRDRSSTRSVCHETRMSTSAGRRASWENERGARHLGRGAGADARRALQRQRVDDSRCRRRRAASAASAQGRCRYRSAGVVRAQWDRRALGRIVLPEHPGVGRSVRRPGPVVVPDRCVSQL